MTQLQAVLPRSQLWALWCALAALAAFICSTVSAETHEPEKDLTAFVSVHVVPMDIERVLVNQTVLVEGTRIVGLGPDLKVPEGARVISGRGQLYLSPGLADMHVHADKRGDLAVYLANGVTTILDMGGGAIAFTAQVRPAVNEGRIPGPYIYSSLRVDGSPRYGNLVASTAEDARAIARLAKANRFDFIKVYNDLSASTFDALIDEARRQQIPIVGHGVTEVGLERQVAAGQALVAHVEEFLYTTFADSDDASDQAYREPSSERVAQAIAFMKAHDAYVMADLNTYATIARQWGRPEVVETFMTLPALRHLSPEDRIRWRAQGYKNRTGDLSAQLHFLSKFTRALSEAGVHLVAGTDAPTIAGLLPGYSLHDALKALRDVGLTPFQTLSVATRVPGEFIQRTKPGSEPFGVIAPGSRADLILSSENPLENLATLRRPLGVMTRGKWYSSVDLQALVEAVEETYFDAVLAPDSKSLRREE
jgi:imidazolonepropionase-like amidohydrolase